VIDLPRPTSSTPEPRPPRPQPRLVQAEVVDGADVQDAPTRKPLADAVHERAARAAEVVGHRGAGGDGRGLRVGRESTRSQ
jgi:hypothetical protein